MARWGTPQRVGVIIASVVALSALVALLTPLNVPGYDTSFTLAWGRDLAHRLALDFTHPSSPTPHPLALLGGWIVGFAPVQVGFQVALGVTVAAGLTALMLVGVVTYELTASRIAVAAAVATTALSAPVSLLVLNASTDITYCALGLGAVLLTVRSHHTAAIAAFMVAALLRPEAVIFAVVPLVLAFAQTRAAAGTRTATRSLRVSAAWAFGLGVGLAAAAWLAMGAAGGDPLIGLHSASSNADANNNAQGTHAALTGAIPGLAAATGWITICAAGITLVVTLLTRRRDQKSVRQSARPRHALSSDDGAQQRATVITGAFIGMAVLAYVAQGLTSTPLVARYLLLPSLLCIALAARCVSLAGRIARTKRASTILSTTVAVILVASATLASLTGWRDVATARAVRTEAFAAASSLLDNGLAQECEAPFVVRSPALVALSALKLDRPLRDITVANQAGQGVLLQPLTLDAAQLAGYGPMTPLAEQATFPTDAPPRQSNAQWALYSACQP